MKEMKNTGNRKEKKERKKKRKKKKGEVHACRPLNTKTNRVIEEYKATYSIANMNHTRKLNSHIS